MLTQQNHNTLVIHNSDFDRQAAEICFAGRVELTTQEIAAFLKWLRQGPVSDHVIVRFGGVERNKYSVTGDRVAFGEIDDHIAREDTLALINQAMVFSATVTPSAKTFSKQSGESHV